MLESGVTIATNLPSETQDGPAGFIESEIRQALDEWIYCVNSGYAESINALYLSDAVLLPTFDGRVLTTPAERLVYFIKFKTRRGLHASVKECYITTLGPDSATANGLYTFRFLGEDGTEQSVRARFTFVYARQQEGDWLIVAHHSSVAPGLS